MVSEQERIEAVRQILIQLYILTDKEFPDSRITRVEREAIFFIYEGTDKYAQSKPHSADARALRKRHSQKDFRQLITCDHAIPLATLREQCKAATASHEAMANCLQRFIQIAIITREEDVRLNKLGLRRQLPTGSAVDDMFARYRAANILFEPVDEELLSRTTA